MAYSWTDKDRHDELCFCIECLGHWSEGEEPAPEPPEQT